MAQASAILDGCEAQEYLQAGLQRLAEKYGPACPAYQCDLRGAVAREELDRVLGEIEEEIQSLSAETLSH